MVTSKFSWMLKDLDLGAKATQCCTYASGGCAVKPAYPSHPFSSFNLVIFYVTFDSFPSHSCVNYNAKRSEIEEEATIVAEAELIAEPVVAEVAEFDSAATTTAFPVMAIVLVAVIALAL